ncbi:RidA family protein [Spirillospora sp. NPDC049024]
MNSDDYPLPPPVSPFAQYRPCRRDGRLLYVSGQVAVEGTRFVHRGRVGAELTLAEGVASARQCGLNVLSAARRELGDLDRVAGVLKLTVFVSADGEFLDHHKVADGASQAITEALGEEVGGHARSAVGVPRLPMDSPVEVEAVLLIG